MDNAEPNTSMPNTPPDMPKVPSKSSWGPIVGLIIILVLIVAGSFYFFVEDDRSPADQTEPSVADIEAELSALQEQGSSDELDDIEEDLENTDLSGLDAEIDLAEQEIDEMEQL